MLYLKLIKIHVPKTEFYDSESETFKTVNETTLELEHSLEAISKWESKWCKAFLGRDEKTTEQVIDYIKCMTLNEVDDYIYLALTNQMIDEIATYIEKPMTATWFNDSHSKPSRDVITSEIIYYWMITLGIPFECQRWHLNRLLTLIKVVNIKNAPPKKMKRKEIFEQNKALNEARKKQYNTKG